MSNPNHPRDKGNSHLGQIIAGVIVTVVGGLILAWLVGEGRFAPTPTPTPTVRQSAPTESNTTETSSRSGDATLNEPSESTPTAVQPTPTTDWVTFHRPNLMSAIRLLGDVEAQAGFDLDPTPLSRVFTGEALKYEQTIIENFEKLGVYMVAQRHDLQYDGFKVSDDGARAEVHVTPTWEARFYLLGTQQCAFYSPPQEAPQTIFLEHGPTGWLAYAIIFDDETPPEYQPCP